MYQSSRQLHGSKVFTSSGDYLCWVKRVIIDHNNGQVLGFVTSLPHPNNILSIMDVLHWLQDSLFLCEDYDFHSSEDLVRIQKALRNHPDLIGKKVRTESKIPLGVVTDFSLDTTRHLLASITAEKSFLKLFYFDGRIIHQNNILEITPKHIIVRDSVIKIMLNQTIQGKSTQRSPAT